MKPGDVIGKCSTCGGNLTSDHRCNLLARVRIPRGTAEVIRKMRKSCRHELVTRRAIVGSEPIARALFGREAIESWFCALCGERFMPANPTPLKKRAASRKNPKEKHK